MKSPRAALVATAIPLLLTSLRVTAGELPFNAPTTEQARQSAPLLHQTARALRDSPSPAALHLLGGKQISNLWLFPTADAHTVFARYNLTSNEEATASAAESATEHLAVLTVDGNRIVESRELTSSPVKSVSTDSPQLHWSAFIGTGDAARASLTQSKTASSGEIKLDTTKAAPSLHWTAGIGTGTAASTSTAAVRDTKQRPSSAAQPAVAGAHWTSRIGTGHALDSTSPAM